jgi:uncharacterized protein YkwD
LAGLVAAVVAAPGTAQADNCVGADAEISASNIAQSERSLVCLTNIYRVQQVGVGALAIDPSLQRAAHDYAQKMSSENFFSHYGGPDSLCDPGTGSDPGNPSCSTPSERAQAAGYPGQAGENIARQSLLATPRSMLTLWQNSPGHDANLRNPGYINAGMGFAPGVYGVQMFGLSQTGATDTAVDLLITDECVAALQAEVDRLDKKRKKAKKKGNRKKAKKLKKKLEAAQQTLAAAQAATASPCGATQY